MSRVLVVDDDSDVVTLISYRLRRQGFDVVTASDGQEALDTLATTSVDLILLDIIMPGMSGLDVLERLRADEATARLPVIMLTARAQEADVGRGFALGADDYVTKPFSLGELTVRIDAALARARR